MKGIIFYGWVENINLAIFKHKIESFLNSQPSLGFSLKNILRISQMSASIFLQNKTLIEKKKKSVLNDDDDKNKKTQLKIKEK